MKQKKWIIVLFVILISVVLGIAFFSLDTNPRTLPIEKEISYLELVEEYLPDMDVSFLTWVDENYEDSMKEMVALLKDEEYDSSMWHQVTGYSYLVLQDFYQKKYDGMDHVKVLDLKSENTLSFVGDISLADNWSIMQQYDIRGQGVNGILSDDILAIMRNSDLMVANSEFTVSNRGYPMPGKLYTFRAKPERLSIYYDMGVDLVTLANNHVYDFGQDAFLDMLDAFDEYKIPRIGAGRNLDEAMKPYYFIIGGYKFSFLSATRAEKYILTPGATETTEGVFRCYDPTNMIEQIKKVREESDYVIALIHFGWEGHHELEDVQVSSAHQYIEAGADAVIGHHAHTLQGVEFYNHKPIIYNLGNFIFSSDWDDTAIFQIQLNEDGSLRYFMIPGLQKNEYTSLLVGDEKQRVLNNLNSWSIHAIFDSEGELKELE